MNLKSRTSLVAIFTLIVLFSSLAGLLYHWNNVRTIDVPVEAVNDSFKKPVVKKKAEGDVDFGPYMADLQRRIKRAWFPPKGNESKRVMVVFKVHNNGTMSDLKLAKSSKVALADQAALKAVQNAAPFKPLPQGAPADVDIQFTFDYNVFKHGKGKGEYRQF